MILRCTIEIIPYGDEKFKLPVCRLDISNIGMIRNDGFGHEISKYDVKLWRHNNPTIRQLLKKSEWVLDEEGVIEEHNRRDGTIKLVHKATGVVDL